MQATSTRAPSASPAAVARALYATAYTLNQRVTRDLFQLLAELDLSVTQCKMLHLLGQERDDEAMSEFVRAERLFETLGSSSHVAASWLAQGDAHKKLGDLDTAASLYRRAAEALQDFNF